MAQVVISNTNQTPQFLIQDASNVKWRKVLNGIGWASFDLPLTDPYADPKYIHAGNFLHIYRDGADTSSFSNADWGGLLENDYEIKPKDGVVTISAAGLAQMLQLSIVPMTTTYNLLDLGSVINNLIQTCDNAATIPLTSTTISPLGPTVNGFIAQWGDPVMQDITTLCTQYGGDFEVTPDFHYNFYARQGVDNPNLVVRYGNQGNLDTDTSMHLVNTEMGNQIWAVNFSTNQSVYVTDPTASQYYGKKTLVIQTDNEFLSLDLLSRAQLELLKRKNPLFVLDKIKIVDSSLFPFYQMHLGDRIHFEAPDLPFLTSFSGFQRILSIDYDDHTRTIDLTLGNAVYVVARGRLHEVRLYT